MNHEDGSEPQARHRFFHSMVVMGGALALGCGGLSDSSDAVQNTTSGAGGGGSGGTGGTTGGGTGGTTVEQGGTGGTIVIGNGGTGGTTVTPGPFACSPAQWDCSANGLGCSGNFYNLPAQCRCDEKRPASAADCAADESFVCREAMYDEMGRTFTQPVPFECSCRAKQLDCGLACDVAYGTQGDHGGCKTEETKAAAESILCGCAVIVLR